MRLDKGIMTAFRTESCAATLRNGFTLIELVVTLIVLGCLAALAVPKFIDMKADARYALLSTMRGTMLSAGEVVHAKALMAGEVGATGTVTMDGEPITLVYGYPDASSTGIGRAVNGLATNYPSPPARGDPVMGFGGSGISYFGYPPIDGTLNTCYVAYYVATATASPNVFVYGDLNGVAGPAQCALVNGYGPTP